MQDTTSVYVYPARGFEEPEEPRSETPQHGIQRRTKSIRVSDATLRENRVIAGNLRDKRADLFRILRRQVLQTLDREGHRTLAVTSARASEGKTLLSVNLAVSLALDVNQTVLLADLDLRQPSVHKYFGFEPEVGLSDYLATGIELSDCLVRVTKFDRLVILPGQGHYSHSSEILTSPRMRNLAQELKGRYDDRLIIYDLPALLSTDDALGFLPQVEALLLVVEDGETQQADLERALEMLDGINVIGTVLNKAKHPFPTL